MRRARRSGSKPNSVSSRKQFSSSRFEQPLHRAGYALPQQRLADFHFQRAELRVDTGRHRVPPQQARAERVNRADPRGIEPADDGQPVQDLHLAARLSQPLGAFGPDAIAHLAGRPVGKRDGDHAGQGRRGRMSVFRRIEIGEKTPREHQRLAAARPGRQADRNVAAADRRLLLFGELAFAGESGLFDEERAGVRPELGRAASLASGGTAASAHRGDSPQTFCRSCWRLRTWPTRQTML